MGIVQTGNIVTTSYGTGPYLLTEVSGPCTCSNAIGLINGIEGCSEPHFHAVCEHNKSGGTFYLNGYTQDGSNVWSEDFLTVVKHADQMSFSF